MNEADRTSTLIVLVIVFFMLLAVFAAPDGTSLQDALGVSDYEWNCTNVCR